MRLWSWFVDSVVGLIGVAVGGTQITELTTVLGVVHRWLSRLGTAGGRLLSRVAHAVWPDVRGAETVVDDGRTRGE